MKKLSLIFVLTLFTQLSFALTGLQKGDKVPEVTLKDTAGKSFSLAGQDKTTVIVFYRGSWCPYCVKQLKSLNEEVVGKLDPKTMQLVAISVDRPKVAMKMKRNFDLKYTVLSDRMANSLKAFKIVNKVDGNLVKTYKNSYKIDIEADSGETHHMIAHPAVFIVKDSKIIYSDIHTNYKERTKNSEILSHLNLK
ncbi:MAG: peroxiredoxin [Bacteriovoracaceae bacterium]|jgi:peroxiredoxin